METERTDTFGDCKDNKEINMDGIDKLYTITIMLRYYEREYYEYNRNETKFVVAKMKNICFYEMILLKGNKTKYIAFYIAKEKTYNGNRSNTYRWIIIRIKS